jgi:hypothetical protein
MLVDRKIQTYLGKIISPCNCCALGVSIYDEKDDYKFYIFGDFF